MNRPKESDYTSQVAYTRALEKYCDELQEQEPVAWVDSYGTLFYTKEAAYKSGYFAPIRALYTHPPKREWVGLMRGVRVDGDTVVITVKGGNESARQLCAKLIKEKNT